MKKRKDTVLIRLIFTISLFLSAYGCEQPLNLPGAAPNGTAASPVFSPEEGLYNTAQEVSITCSTPAASIYYTTDGTVPTENSTLYIGTISVSEQNSPLIITARTFLTSMTPSAPVSKAYRIDDTDPVIGAEVYGWNTDSG